MDSSEELGMTIENPDETRSRRDYNRYVIAYDSVIPMASDALKAAVYWKRLIRQYPFQLFYCLFIATLAT